MMGSPYVCALAFQGRHIGLPLRVVPNSSPDPALAVPGSTTLHAILQAAMGWTDSHLHQFTINGVRYGDTESDKTGELGFRTEGCYPLDLVVLKARSRFDYLYDFGDSWEHTRVVEAIRPRPAAWRVSAQARRRTLAGCGDIRHFWKPGRIPSTRSMTSFRSGLVEPLIRKPLTRRPSTGGSAHWGADEKPRRR